LGRFGLRAVGFGVAVAAACAAPAALADGYDDAVAACALGTLEQPFAAWGDAAAYTSLANGSFESGAVDWSLTGDAYPVGEDEPAFVDDADDATALKLARGSSATSAPVCVTHNTPTLRFFARNNGASGARLRVDALIKDGTGKIKALPVATISASTAWAPTDPLALNLSAYTGMTKLDAMGVAFRFSAITGSWKIDRVYLDPLKDC
jgi:hypothetical protein